jgi:1-acyl-sn-glycerol-3-phosphate acyltransferase
VTNCRDFDDCMHVISCTDRAVRFILFEDDQRPVRRTWLRSLARRTGLVVLKSGATHPKQQEKAVRRALFSLRRGTLVALSGANTPAEPDFESFLAALRSHKPAAGLPLVPIFCGHPEIVERAHPEPHPDLRKVRVFIGEPLPPDASVAEIRAALDRLAREMEDKELHPTSSSSVTLPAAATALPTRPGPVPPADPSPE